MLTISRLVPVALGSIACTLVLSSCGFLGGANGGSTDAYDSEVATSVVSGTLNNTMGTTVGYNFTPLPKEHPSMFARVADALNPVRDAWAATWTCSGATLTPTYAGAASNPYTYTPVSCSVTWDNHQTASSKWSGTFGLSYGAMCDNTHGFIGDQVAGCSITRTTAMGGNTRTITGPDGSSYAILHDTNGAGTGWDASVQPAPSNSGVVVTCGTGGCATGGTLSIGGSHLTGTVTLGQNGKPVQIWNHTVSTGTGGLTVAGTGTNRSVSGTVTVQHNILRYTATTTFNNVTYGSAGCCFPTSGSVSATFNSGVHSGRTETLTFSATCGEATLKTANGQTIAYTLQHCM